MYVNPKRITHLLCLSLLFSFITYFQLHDAYATGLSYSLQESFESYGTAGQPGSTAPIGSPVNETQPWKNDFGSGLWSIDEEIIPSTTTKNHFMKQTALTPTVSTNDYWGQSLPEIITSNITISAKVKVLGSSGTYAGLAARYAPDGSSHEYYRFMVKKNSASYQFYIEKAFGSTGNSKSAIPLNSNSPNTSGVTIPNTTLAQAMDNLGYLPLKMNIINNLDSSVTLECYYGTTLVLSATDPASSAPYVSGQAGVYSNAGATAFDDFQVTPYYHPVITPLVINDDKDSAADLKWTVAIDNSYDIRRQGPGESTYTVIATNVAQNALPGPFTYTATGLSNSSTYNFIVTARNVPGQTSDSAPIAVSPHPIVTIPAAPTSVTTSQTNNTVLVRWPSVNGAQTYNVYRSTSSSGPFTSPIATGLGLGDTSPTLAYTDNGLVQGTYYYAVTGVNSIGEGPLSPITSIQVNPPAPPELTAIGGTREVFLTWTDVNDASSYNILRSTNSGSGYTFIGTSPTTTYTDTTVANGTMYYYVAQSANAVGSSPNSAEVSASTQVPPSTNFDLSHWKLTIPDSTASEISVAQLANGYTSPYFYTDPSDGSMTFWAPVNGGTTSGSSFPRSELREMLVPNDNTTNWMWSGIHTMTATEKVTVVPSTGKVIALQIHGVSPTGGNANPLVKMQYDSNKHAVDFLAKNASVGGSDTHFVFGGIHVGDTYNAQIQVIDGVLYMTVNGVTQSYDFIAADPGWKDLQFYFKAGAYTQDNVGPSTEGGVVKIYSLHVTHQAQSISTPTGLTGAEGISGVTLDWNPVNRATSYNILRSTTSGSGYVPIGTTTGTSFTDSTTSDGITYSYVVTAENVGGVSGTSNEVSVTIDLTPPTTTDNAPLDWVNHNVVVNLTAVDTVSGVAATYYELDDSGPLIGNTVAISSEGIHTLRYWSVDVAGNVETDKSLTIKLDKTAPTTQLTLDTASLWPANHKLVTVTATLNAIDSLSSMDHIVLTSITCNDPSLEATDIQDADYGSLDLTFKLRADKANLDIERIYTITYTATDRAGNNKSVSATVKVPHDHSDTKPQ
ncbi:polysaccharide lyase family 7 protein [Paenibacillus roseipurpureus]|uniref:Polysaccharide lyase family 7 protein n=1 Tax=Paenibacillus roseopurpureus TaxID=2918901 RepID=A0AA96LNK4_9BACL|nr:polysaccharide lyase family 7 protein [Paenibacillus sp. MBLB1832]WNR43826.1 polysaccharide lyase family 7 protein [Paenibacillus sp. MBLB1832]